MPSTKRRKRGPGLLWRLLFGHNGPTKSELKKLLGLTFSKTFPVKERDAVTGRVRTRYMRVEADGKVHEVKAPAKKKRTAAKKSTGRRAASQPSKPSRTSGSGSTPRRQAGAPAAPARPRRKVEPLADRVLRNPDGTLAGSRPADPVKQLRQAEQAYLKASRRAEVLLGWQKSGRR